MRPRFPPFEPLLADFPSPHRLRSVIPDTGACDKHHGSAWHSAFSTQHSAGGPTAGQLLLLSAVRSWLNAEG